MVLGVSSVVVVVLVVLLARALAFEVPEEFLTQKGELAAVSIEPLGGDAAYDAYDIVLDSSAGYHVRGYLRVPRDEGVWPAVLVIGGTNTGRMAAELFTPDDPYVILGLDYPWDGPTKLSWFQFLMRVLAVRRAMLLTPSAVMLGVDYLESRPDVDTSRVVLAGASFGAQLISVAGALDSRAASVLIVYGGADYDALLRTNLKVKPMWLRSVLARAGASLLAPIEPARYVGQIAPRQTIIINGSGDDRIPRHSVERLYESAKAPKRLIWLDEGHISPRDTELLERVLRAAISALGSDNSDPRKKERGVQ